MHCVSGDCCALCTHRDRCSCGLSSSPIAATMGWSCVLDRPCCSGVCNSNSTGSSGDALQRFNRGFDVCLLSRRVRSLHKALETALLDYWHRGFPGSVVLVFYPIPGCGDPYYLKTKNQSAICEFALGDRRRHPLGSSGFQLALGGCWRFIVIKRETLQRSDRMDCHLAGLRNEFEWLTIDFSTTHRLGSKAFSLVGAL